MQISGSTILIVDDEPNVLRTVKAILSQEGYAVDTCPDGTSAIQRIRQRSYDLVVTDLKMPGDDGLAVLAEVRKRSPNTVTVMMTGYGSVDSAIEALKLGAYEYLMKPVDVSELKAAVSRALERKRFSESDTLYNLGMALATSVDRQLISEQVCGAATRVLQVANAKLLSFERDLAIVDCNARNLSIEDTGLCELLATTPAFSKLSDGEVIAHESASEDLNQWARQRGIESFTVVPGLAAGRLICALWSDDGNASYDFHASALRFLRALANQAALALENARLISELRNSNIELAAANQKLRELDRLKSQFLAVATHELRTPLSVILGYNSMLAESLGDRLMGDERDTLRESMSACRKLIGMVNSMLDISQIESGRMRMNFAVADIAQLIRSVVALMHYEAERKGIALQAAVADDLPWVQIDAERIQQVLVNLVANALKFTDPGGSVLLRAQSSPMPDTVEIQVQDTGVGIESQYHATIFDEFAQVHRPMAARQRKGSGLGLAIARRIVEAHQGTIHVESAVGKGSTFTVLLPVRAGMSLVNTAMSA